MNAPQQSHNSTSAIITWLPRFKGRQYRPPFSVGGVSNNMGSYFKISAFCTLTKSYLHYPHIQNTVTLSLQFPQILSHYSIRLRLEDQHLITNGYEVPQVRDISQTLFLSILRCMSQKLPASYTSNIHWQGRQDRHRINGLGTNIYS